MGFIKSNKRYKTTRNQRRFDTYTSVSYFLILIQVHLNEFSDYEGGKLVNGIMKHLSHDHDIGLVKVKNPFIFDDFVKPICLPTDPEFEMSEGNGIITGFGTMEDG